jgi:hypothetical protein
MHAGPWRWGETTLKLQKPRSTTLRYVSLVDAASVLPLEPADTTHCRLAFLT